MSTSSIASACLQIYQYTSDDNQTANTAIDCRRKRRGQPSMAAFCFITRRKPYKFRV
jgi:hypothetical protein